jgi:hypothetical protein
MHTAKLTSKNQLTLPKAAVEALGRPTQFRVVVAQGNLVLIPARLTSAEEVCATLARGGMAPEQVDQAQRLLAGRKGGCY